MSYTVDTETIDDYDIGDKIYEHEDGSILYFAQSKKVISDAHCVIRVRNANDEASKTKFFNEKMAYTASSRLKPYALPLVSVFTENGKNYTVYKNSVGNYVHRLVKSNDFIRDNKDELKDYTTSYLAFFRKLKKLKLFPIDDSAADNITTEHGKIFLMGFENVIPAENGNKEGITTEISKISGEDFGIKTSFLKQANFIHYLYTGKDAVSKNGLKILEDKFKNHDILSLVKDCTTKSSEELKNFNPFMSKFLHHDPVVNYGTNFLSVDDIKLTWGDEITIEIGGLSVQVDLSSSNFMIKEGRNEINLGADGIDLNGTVPYWGCQWNNKVRINGNGIKMFAGPHDEITIDSDGLFNDGQTGRLYIIR